MPHTRRQMASRPFSVIDKHSASLSKPTIAIIPPHLRHKLRGAAPQDPVFSLDDVAVIAESMKSGIVDEANERYEILLNERMGDLVRRYEAYICELQQTTAHKVPYIQ